MHSYNLVCHPVCLSGKFQENVSAFGPDSSVRVLW